MDLFILMRYRVGRIVCCGVLKGVGFWVGTTVLVWEGCANVSECWSILYLGLGVVYIVVYMLNRVVVIKFMRVGV